MRITEEHFLEECTLCSSPNFDDRPYSESPSLVVVHGISLPPGEFGTGMVERLFLNRLDEDFLRRHESLRGLRVSSHVLISRRGEATQFVAFDKRAWHAGESTYKGRHKCNDFSIGIELEGTDDSGYTDAQYHQLTGVTRALINRYESISLQHIVGHAEISPGRKTDPGASFDWTRLMREVARVPLP